MRSPAIWACSLALLLAACGGSSGGAPVPAWRAAHPDPQEMTFDEQAPGVCAVSVQYPDEAPAAIEFQDAVYVQGSKKAKPAQPPGVEIEHSGDWTIFQPQGGGLSIVTTQSEYDYKQQSGC